MRRISAYGLCQDEQGRVLLVRTGEGAWALPGAVVAHGEDPRTTVLRAFTAQVDIAVQIDGARDVVTDIDAGPDGSLRQDEQLIFDAHTSEPVSGADVRWATPRDLDDLPLTARTARLLGRGDGVAGKDDDWDAGQPGPAVRRQRFASYALATDPKGNVLLALISPDYPGAGLWHLPGGGTHLGEPAVAGMLRELTEETGQTGRVDSVLDVASLYDVQAMGPEGVPIDFHGVSAVYRVRVDKPTRPRVLESGGSTAEAGWFAPHEALTLPLTGTARKALLRALAAR